MHYCPYCKKNTAYSAGGILGVFDNYRRHFMACDSCGSKWEEVLVMNPDEEQILLEDKTD